jgi:hypothetical protein
MLQHIQGISLNKISLINHSILFRAFESVVDHMEQNAKNIDDLRLKIEAKHSSVLSDKEVEARAKQQQLKGTAKRPYHTYLFFLAYEERLQFQAKDFERERKNLQDLITRLEVHLSEQTKLVEEVFIKYPQKKQTYIFLS